MRVRIDHAAMDTAALAIVLGFVVATLLWVVAVATAGTDRDDATRRR
jgi:hypothetical protein